MTDVCVLPSPPGLAGSDDVENAQIAAVLVAVEDVGTEVLKMVREKDEDKKVRVVTCVFKFHSVPAWCTLTFV